MKKRYGGPCTHQRYFHIVPHPFFTICTIVDLVWQLQDHLPQNVNFVAGQKEMLKSITHTQRNIIF